MMLQKYTDMQLAIELLIRLGGIHSATGVSIRRSWRSALREAVMSLIGDLRREEETSCDLFELIEEADSRSAHIFKQEILFDSTDITINALPNWWLATELLYHLQSWYEEDTKRLDSLLTEKRIINAVCLLLCSPHKNLFDVKLLLLEADDRFSDRVQRKNPCP